MNSFFAVVILMFATVTLAFELDTRRRRLCLTRTEGWRFLTALDVISVACTIAFATLLIGQSTVFLRVSYCIFVLVFLWKEGKRQIQLQRPAGVVFAEWCLLAGFYFVVSTHTTAAPPLKLAPMVAGATLLGLLLPTFLQAQEKHRILRQLATQGEFVQQEWTKPTQECPFPNEWKMFDAQSAELEVLELLKALVVSVKPHLILETGTFLGRSSIKMAEGLRANGYGKLITVERDPTVFAKATKQIEEHGLPRWIDAYCDSSLNLEVNGTIDILYCDSDLKICEAEIRKYLPQVRPGGLVLIHDASSSFQIVRNAALQLEQEGLLSVVLLPTPRGLVIAQKREGRV